MDPSSWHGVTTAMIGNCGVGFAPCKPHQREVMVALMEGVEDIPEVVLTEGLTWEWETFPDYLDRLGERQYDLDIVTQVPHAALRVYVMGDRGAKREPATPEDMQEMARLVVEGDQGRGARLFHLARDHSPDAGGRAHAHLWRSGGGAGGDCPSDGRHRRGVVPIDHRFRRPGGGVPPVAPGGRARSAAHEPHARAARGQDGALEAAARPDRAGECRWHSDVCASDGAANRVEPRLPDLPAPVRAPPQLQGAGAPAMGGAPGRAGQAGRCAQPSWRRSRRTRCSVGDWRNTTGCSCWPTRPTTSRRSARASPPRPRGWASRRPSSPTTPCWTAPFSTGRSRITSMAT